MNENTSFQCILDSKHFDSQIQYGENKGRTEKERMDTKRGKEIIPKQKPENWSGHMFRRPISNS